MKKTYFIFGIAFLWATILEGKTWKVPSEIPTIKSAVEDSAQDNDTVLVAPGTYNEYDIKIENKIVLISERGRDSTIIDANSMHRVFSCIDVDTTVISGFTIREGKYSEGGGGIYCSNSFLFIFDNLITANYVEGGTSKGSGIFGNNSSLVIENNVITNNVGGHYSAGGGIDVENCLFVLIKNNIIADNYANCFGAGGGIGAGWCSSLIIENNIITNNVANDNGMGGGIKTTNVAGVIRNNIITGNSAVHTGGGYQVSGGGIDCYYYHYEGSPLTIEYNLIANNFAKKGGGIASGFENSPDSSLVIRFNAIIDNSSGIWSTGVVSDTNHVYYNLYVSDSSMQDILYPEIPGEPSTVNSIKIYEDSTYTNELSVADIGDTFWIELKGLDWNNLTIDPGVVIITSQKDSYGIAVVLIETDTATGVYQGFARVDTISDDMWNKIGADSGDTIIVCANIDPTQCDTVIVKGPGVEETDYGLQITDCRLEVYPNPFTRKTEIRFQIPDTRYQNSDISIRVCDRHLTSNISLKIHDISGRLIREFPIHDSQFTTHEVTWDARDKSGKKVGSGIYFCVLETPDFKQIKKLVIFK